MMRSIVLVTVLLLAAGIPPAGAVAQARQTAGQPSGSQRDTAAKRAAGERFLADRTQSCAPASAADLQGWPAGDEVAVTTDVFFVQPVDDELVQEQHRAARAMIASVLQPLGIRIAAEGERTATIAFTGVAEALTPEGAAGRTVFNGASWRGAISLHLRGRCVFARGFESRMQPAAGPRAVAVAAASDAPFLDCLEPSLLDALVATGEAIRGQEGLSRIATSDADSRACLLALGRISDQDVLVGIARTAKAPWLRVPAVAKLRDVDRLAAIAKIDPDPDVRRAALARIAELKRHD